jgi:thiamine-monophosphate kinase
MVAPDPQRLGQVGEDGVLRQVLGRYLPPPDWLRVPPGDDAAVIDPAVFGAAGVVAAMDTVVEGRDFVREWSTGADVGVKVAAQNFADIAAMGARPVALLVSLTAPGDLPLDFVTGLADGLAAECARAGAVVAGGDLSDGEAVVVSATALGAVVSGVVRRRGASAGDVVALAGVLGGSAAGLALLTAGVTGPVPDEGEAEAAVAWALAAHRRPAPLYSAGPVAAAAGATAMIDVSDGLVRDAARVAAASGVELDLQSKLLVPDPRLTAVAAVLEQARPEQARPGQARLAQARLVQEWVMTGGEDHALLACFPPGTSVPPPFRRIGTVLPVGAQTAPAEPQFAVRLDGVRWSGSPGWRHWPIPES